MPSGQTIVNNALTLLGILEQGGIPSVSDSNDSLTELNVMWDAWKVDEGLIYSEQSFSGALSTTVGSYTIGTGATFNTPRPSRIYQAFVTVAGNRNELAIVGAQKYYEHNDLAAAAGTPDELYPDFNVNGSGFATLYLWPVPTFGSGSPQLQLIVGVTFSAWTLGANYLIPYAYQDAIEKALAWRLIPRFGMAVDQNIAAVVAQLGQKAEARLRTANVINRQMPAQLMGLQPPAQPAAGE